LLTFSKLYMALAMCRTQHPDSTMVFSLEVITWDEFRKNWVTAYTPSNDVSERIKECDIFLGGIDWTVNYL
jgi:hypothetical protein